MTDPTRVARSRRGGRRPGWGLSTALLVLAIAASSALVFTDRVELLKLAVMLALWAAVVAAFVSVIYRRQSDLDQARARDLKLVYDLQLDREISARREYELTVESQLRHKLASELRAQAADEVASLRAELAALRTNLEILFDADLGHRPAIETERTTVRAYSDWARDSETTGRVSSSRIDAEREEDREEDVDARTEESPIIDVPAEPHPSEPEWASTAGYAGAHRRPSEEAQGQRYVAEEPPPSSPPPSPEPQPEPEPETEWQPVTADGQWIPAGTSGSNWAASVEQNGSTEYRGVGQAAPEPAMSVPPQELRGRHSLPPHASDPGRPAQPPPEESVAARHRSPDESAGGQSVAELLARLQATPTGGGHRRRRED